MVDITNNNKFCHAERTCIKHRRLLATPQQSSICRGTTRALRESVEAPRGCGRRNVLLSIARCTWRCKDHKSTRAHTLYGVTSRRRHHHVTAVVVSQSGGGGEVKGLYRSGTGYSATTRIVPPYLPWVLGGETTLARVVRVTTLSEHARC